MEKLSKATAQGKEARRLARGFSGLDEDLYSAQAEDLKTISKIQQQLSKVRSKLGRI